MKRRANLKTDFLMPPQVTHYLAAILEDCLIRCIHFLQSAAAASNGTSCSVV